MNRSANSDFERRYSRRSPPEEGERELVLDAEFAAPLDESRLYGGDDVLGTVALHMTTVSR
jgi:hypothetical protein